MNGITSLTLPCSHHCNTTGLLPFPTHYYLARHWCCGAINLVWRKSKIREKTDLGAWGRDKPSRETGEDCLAISPRSERSGKRPTIEGKRVNERGWVACSTCLQWKQVYATLPYPTTFTPPPPPTHTHTHNPSTIFLLSHFFLAASLNYNDSFYHTLLIGKTVSLKFNRLCFNSVL